MNKKKNDLWQICSGKFSQTLKPVIKPASYFYGYHPNTWKYHYINTVIIRMMHHSDNHVDLKQNPANTVKIPIVLSNYRNQHSDMDA